MSWSSSGGRGRFSRFGLSGSHLLQWLDLHVGTLLGLVALAAGGAGGATSAGGTFLGQGGCGGRGRSGTRGGGGGPAVGSAALPTAAPTPGSSFGLFSVPRPRAQQVGVFTGGGQLGGAGGWGAGAGRCRTGPKAFHWTLRRCGRRLLGQEWLMQHRVSVLVTLCDLLQRTLL